MTTVINNPSGGDSAENAGAGVVVGVLLAIVLIILFFIYGLPAIRGNQSDDNGSIDINVDLPTGGNSNSGGGSPAPSGGGSSGGGTGY